MHAEFIVNIPDLPEGSGVQEFNTSVVEICQRVCQAEAALATIADDAENVELAELRKRMVSTRTTLHADHRALLVASINRQQLLKQLEKPLRITLEAAEATLERSRQKTARALEKAGCGPMDQPNAQFNVQAAEARFRHTVENSADVRAAREMADQAAQNLKEWATLTRDSAGVITRQRDRLKALTRQLLRV
jgi:hypothetical protein